MAIRIGYCPLCLRKVQLTNDGFVPAHEPTNSKAGNLRCRGRGAVPVAKPTSSKEDRSNPPIADEPSTEEPNK